MNQLRNIFGLGKREAESIVLDVTSKVYRKRLSQAVSAGELEAADSKAAFLQNICEELHFDPERASQIHEGNGSCNACHMHSLFLNIHCGYSLSSVSFYLIMFMQ